MKNYSSLEVESIQLVTLQLYDLIYTHEEQGEFHALATLRTLGLQFETEYQELLTQNPDADWDDAADKFCQRIRAEINSAPAQ